MPLDDQQRLRALGERAAAAVEDGMLVGLGTGSTAAAMVDALGRRVQEGLRVSGIATSHATFDQATQLGIPMVDLNDIDRMDLCIDGADEIDPDLNVVKGRGGALLFEKLVARRADRYIIIATAEKLVRALGERMPLPIEVIPEGCRHTAEEITQTGFSPVLRMQPGGEPYRTDGGHVILDCTWPEGSDLDPAWIADALKAITGVVDHGLFIGMVDQALTIDDEREITVHRGASRD